MKFLWLGLKLEVDECEIIPYGYGTAWCEFIKKQFACFPIPLHIIASYIRRFYFYMNHSFIHYDSIEIEVENRARILFSQWKEQEMKLLEVKLKVAEELLLRILYISNLK